jgi:transcription elongation GreA/GreB family factor
MLKDLLFAHCQDYIKAKQLLLEKQKDALQLALTSESKSSAGDKHETGRAMIQLEREKLGNQIVEVEQNQQRLNTLKNHKSTESVTIGSIVLTDNENYFIAIAADFCDFEGKKYYCISPQSPIGTRLLGKKVRDQIKFNGRLSTLLEIL